MMHAARRTFLFVFAAAALLLPPEAASGQDFRESRWAEVLASAADDLEGQVVAWRRHLHANPELGNREFETASFIAEHLRALGMEVRTGVAHTGVVGILRGGRPGPVVALRSDMDALPVTELTGLPFASTVRTEYNGDEVGVMHACGHDNHMAILMGVAQILAERQDELPGTVVFLFQPAEEGAPAGEEGGADLMLREGVFDDPRPEAVFGLHVRPDEVGTVNYVPRGAMAASDGLRIVIRGRQTHGAMPWDGVDPIVVASQVVVGLQTVVSRQSNITRAPAIVTVGSIHGGVRGNIIPDSVVLVGTIRTFESDMQEQVHERVRRTARDIASASGAEADVSISIGYPVTYNDPDLVDRMLPAMRWAAGTEQVRQVPPWTGAEDFSYFAQEAPGIFLFLGGRPSNVPAGEAPANHSPYFFVDEGALKVGVRTLAALALDFLERGGKPAAQ